MPMPQPQPSRPVFGVADDDVAFRTHPFALRVYGPGRSHADVEFTCYDLDTSALVQIGRAQSEQQMVSAVIFGLEKALVDDDGIPSTWDHTAEEVVEERAEQVARRRLGAAGDVDVIPDEEDYREAEAELLAEANDEAAASSRRRFFGILGDPDRRVLGSALVELGQMLGDSSQDLGPTSGPAGSSTKRYGPGPGSRGRRR